MVTSKLCDCGTMYRVECMCGEFEDMVERDAWLEDLPDIEDVDPPWDEYDGGDDGA